MSANSAPTKKALPAKSATATRSAPPSGIVATAVLCRAGVPFALLSRVGFHEQQCDPVDASPVEARDPQERPHRDGNAELVEVAAVERFELDDVADGGEPLEMLGDETAHRVRLATLGELDTGLLHDLVRPQQARDGPRAVAELAEPPDGLVLLVADLADDLLDDVLQGHDPVRAAVLVDDDGELDP